MTCGGQGEANLEDKPLSGAWLIADRGAVMGVFVRGGFSATLISGVDGFLICVTPSDLVLLFLCC